MQLMSTRVMSATRFVASRRVGVALLCAAWILITSGCATVHVLLPGAKAPAASGEVKVKKDRNDNTVLLIEASHLPPPSALAEGHDTYVAWISPDSVKYTNLGSLSVGKDRSGHLEAKTPYKSYELLVTVETSASVSTPSSYVVLRKVTKHTIAKFEGEVSSLQTENSSILDEKAMLEKSIEGLAEYRTALEAEIERLGGDKVALTEQFADAQEDLDLVEAELQAKREALEASYAELEKKNEELVEKQAALETAMELLLEKKAELKAKTVVLEDKQAQLEFKTLELTKKQKELEEATKLLSEEKLVLLEHKKALEETTSLLEKKQAALESKQAIIEKISKKQEQAEERLAMLESMLEQFKQMIEGGELTMAIRDGKMILELPSAVLFKSGSAKLTKQGKKAIEKIAAVLVGIEGRDLQVAGHTDDVPIKSKKFKSNWDLSAARAISVVLFLVDQGIDPSLISAAGYAEHQPIADNATEEGKALNRRIEIVILPNLDELPDLTELESAL